MKEKILKTQNGTIHYWISEDWHGKRETLIFLHGLTADHTMFESQVTYFDKNYNVLVWDAPAHGISRPYLDFTYAHAVECLKTILITNQVEKSVLIGQSFGGFIAQAFLARYPAMVKALIGIDTTPYGEIYYTKSDKWWLKQIEWMSNLFPGQFLKKSIAKQNTATREGYENMLSMLEIYQKKELCHLMGITYAGFFEDNRDLQIDCPVLLLLGEKDKTGKVKQYNHTWSKHTGFPLVIIKNAAHNSNVDCPEAVNQAIEQFLKTM